MAIPLILGAASAIPGIIKGIQGIKQRREAKKLTPEQFQFIPPALRENLASQRNIAASARMPGQAQAEANVRQQSAQALNAAGAGSLADKIAAAQGIQAQGQRALGDIATRGAQFQAQEQNELQDMLNQQAQLEQQNQQRFEQTKLGLMDAGTQNIFGGVSDVASGITGGAWEGAGGALGNIFGKRRQPNTPTLPSATPFTNYQQGYNQAMQKQGQNQLSRMMPLSPIQPIPRYNG